MWDGSVGKVGEINLEDVEVYGVYFGDFDIR